MKKAELEVLQGAIDMGDIKIVAEQFYRGLETGRGFEDGGKCINAE